jgi:hypothetical protein
MKRFLLLLTLLLTSAGIAFAQSVTVNKIWLEKDVTINGKLGMKVHFYLETHGLKDVPMSAIAYFDEPKGIGVKDTDGRWCTTSGTVAIWADFTPIYENSTWNDYWFFTAYEDLHIQDYSKTYYCHVFIFDKQGKQYGNTDYVAFQVKRPTTATSAPSHQATPAAKTAITKSVTVNKIWLEHGVTQNDQDGLRVHIEVELNGYKGSDMRAIAYFESPKGVGHKDLNNRYRTTDGNVSVSEKFSPSYDNSTFNDLKIFIPNSELHLKEGKHTY